MRLTKGVLKERVKLACQRIEELYKMDDATLRKEFEKEWEGTGITITDWDRATVLKLMTKDLVVKNFDPGL